MYTRIVSALGEYRSAQPVRKICYELYGSPKPLAAPLRLASPVDEVSLVSGKVLR